jgi:hypothetical protein
MTWEFVLATAADEEAEPTVVRAALAELAGLRRALDAAEGDLIDAARRQGTGWGEIAAALGLRSRQAAEQRRLRLAGPEQRNPGPAREHRRGQRVVDDAAGETIVSLRMATLTTLRRLDRDPDWDARDARAALVRHSLRTAAAAPPGALYALVDKAMSDLDEFAGPVAGGRVGRALAELRAAWAAATPAATPATTPA